MGDELHGMFSLSVDVLNALVAIRFCEGKAQ